MNNAETFIHDYERHAQARKQLGQANKAVILDALAAAHITEVLVEFDGVGDSGQIESVTVVRNKEPVTMPATKVTLRQASWASTETTLVESSLPEAIETLCYDFLEVEHGGWENNDGAYGEFRLDVAQRTVELEFNGRFTDVSTSHHSF